MTDVPSKTEVVKRRSRVLAELWKFIEIFALCGLAFAQPIFDIVSRNVIDLLIPLRAGRTDVVAIAVLALFLPPTGVWLASAIVRALATTHAELIHRLVLGSLTFVVVLQILGPRLVTPVPFSVGFVVSSLAIFGMPRTTAIRTFLRIFSISPVLFAAIFIGSPSIRPLAFSSNSDSGSIPTPGNLARVVMIVLDELPTQSLLNGNGEIEERLYPNFAALADDAKWFRNTTSVAPYTRIAVPALVTGVYPTDAESVPLASEYPRSLFSALGETYRMNVHEPTIERLCSVSYCEPRYVAPLRNRLLDVAANVRIGWFRRLTQGPYPDIRCACDMTRKNQWSLAQRFVRSLEPSAVPTLDYLHVELPHSPWNLTKDGQIYEPGVELTPGLVTEVGGFADDGAAVRARQRHLVQLMATDQLLGEVVAKLKEIDAYDDSLIVVSADHGVAFAGGDQYRTATETNFDQVAFVPLFVKLPGAIAGFGSADDRPARSIDVLPTILDAIDLDSGWELDGTSLLGDSNDPKLDQRDEFSFLEWPYFLSAPPPQSINFFKFDRAEGLRRVLGAQALPPGATSAAEIYRLGPYANLIGQPIDRYLRDSEPVAGVLALVTNSGDFLDTRVMAPTLPAALARGGLDGDVQRMLAIEVHGIIAGVAPTYPNYFSGPEFAILIDSAYLSDGLNDVRVYEVSGPVSSPVLQQIERV